MITGSKQMLVELDGDVADQWQGFAEGNGVSVDSLLEALGPIMSAAGSGDQVGQLLRSALTQASS